jgi:hypothetical protein
MHVLFLVAGSHAQFIKSYIHLGTGLDKRMSKAIADFIPLNVSIKIITA